jgi:DNA-directed RNA polymerase specialized sigma24 family protein
MRYEGDEMHHSTQTQNLENSAVDGIAGGFSQVPEMHLYSRYEHGNLPVRVFRTPDNDTHYEVTYPSEANANGEKKIVYTSARKMISSFYGHDVHMPFDRYFRIGRYRKQGRASGNANLLTLLDSNSGSSKKTPITVHGGELKVPSKTPISVDPSLEGSLNSPDPVVAEFVKAIEEDLLPEEAFIEPTQEMKDAFDKAFTLELDRLEGVVGIELGAKSERKGVDFKADEVRKLLWRGFAGKMLSQGYDPEDVLQEVYRGLLVRNKGKCPWDARKSTFGHYVYMVIGCVLTNHHRKQARRADRNAMSLTMTNKDGEELIDVGQFGSCQIHEGSELGDMLALDELAGYLETLPDVTPEAELARQILSLVASGHQRAEIVRETGKKPSLVSRALAWLRRQTALWATEMGMGRNVPAKYLVPA